MSKILHINYVDRGGNALVFYTRKGYLLVRHFNFTLNVRKGAHTSNKFIHIANLVMLPSMHLV
jgi:hypothetical protein